jgi:hypothetical protein
MMNGILKADSVVKLTVSKVSAQRGKDRKPTGWFAREISIHTVEGDDLTIRLSSMDKAALSIKQEETQTGWMDPKIYNPDYQPDPEGDPGDEQDD